MTHQHRLLIAGVLAIGGLALYFSTLRKSTTQNHVGSRSANQSSVLRAGTNLTPTIQRDLMDPSTLGVPDAPDFALTTGTITEGAIKKGTHPDTPPANPDTHPSVVREKVFCFQQPLRDLIAGVTDGSPLPQITIPLFDGEEVDVQFMRHEPIDHQNGSLIGVVMGANDSQVVLGYSDEAQAGTIRLSDEEVYSVFYNGNHEHRLVQVDLSKAPPCGHDHGVEVTHHHHEE